MISTIDSLSEYHSVVKTSEFVIIDFFATWCGPCIRIKPEFEKLSQKYPNVNFYQVDVEEGGDGKIMSWGFYVPDVLPSLTKEEYEERNLRTFNGKFFMSSNSYFKFPEGAEYEGAYGPWIFTWLSLTPGGAPIGGREGVNQYVSSGITGRGMDQYISMEPITQTDEINTSRVLYAGNTYGKRYFNLSLIHI